MTGPSPSDERSFDARAHQLLAEIELLMRAQGLWSAGVAPPPSANPAHLGMAYEQWFQFYFLPSVRGYLATGAAGRFATFPVGLGALRHFEGGPESDALIRACHQLEVLLEGRSA